MAYACSALFILFSTAQSTMKTASKDSQISKVRESVSTLTACVLRNVERLCRGNWQSALRQEKENECFLPNFCLKVFSSYNIY